MKKIALFVFLLVALSAASLYAADITIDNTSSATTNGQSLTFDHTIGSGSDRLLTVCVGAEERNGSYDVTGITFNGAPMTKVIDNAVGSRDNAEIWYMLSPPVGTYTISINTTGASNLTAGAVSVTGAAQQAAEATNFSGTTSSITSIQTDITTVTDGAWIFDCIIADRNVGSFTEDSGQTERWEQAASSSHVASSTEVRAVAGSETLGWSWSLLLRGVLRTSWRPLHRQPTMQTATAWRMLQTTARQFPTRAQADTDGDGFGDACDICP